MIAVYGKKTSGFYNNSTEYSVTVMWSSIHIIYVNTSEFKLQVSIYRYTQISIYIYSPNHRLVYIHQPAFLGVYA